MHDCVCTTTSFMHVVLIPSDRNTAPRFMKQWVPVDVLDSVSWPFNSSHSRSVKTTVWWVWIHCTPFDASSLIPVALSDKYEVNKKVKGEGGVSRSSPLILSACAVLSQLKSLRRPRLNIETIWFQLTELVRKFIMLSFFSIMSCQWWDCTLLPTDHILQLVRLSTNKEKDEEGLAEQWRLRALPSGH